MKKLATIFGILIAEFYSLPLLFPVHAQNLCPPGYDNLCKIDVGTNPNIVANVVQLFIVIAVVLSVIFLIWGGIKWIMSNGDKGKVEQAKSAIVASIIGLIVSLLAYFIISVIFYILTGKNDMNIPMPKLV